MKKRRSDNGNYNKWLNHLERSPRQKKWTGCRFFLDIFLHIVILNKNQELMGAGNRQIKKIFSWTHIFLDLFGLLILNVGIFNL